MNDYFKIYVINLCCHEENEKLFQNLCDKFMLSWRKIISKFME